MQLHNYQIDVSVVTPGRPSGYGPQPGQLAQGLMALGEPNAVEHFDY